MGMKPVAILPAKGTDIPPKFLKTIKKITYFYLKNERFRFYENGPVVSLYDYFWVGEPLRFLLRNLDESCRNKDKILEGFKTFIKYVDSDKEPGIRSVQLARILTLLLSSSHIGFFLFRFSFYTSNGYPKNIHDCYYVELIHGEMLHVKLDNHNRPAYRIGHPGKDNVEWSFTHPSKIGIKSTLDDLKIDIYIQKHALNRLHERLDCLEWFIIHLCLVESLDNVEVVKNKQGKNLIAFKAGGKKAGYLVYEYVEGVVVITTFLLLTNNGTPEGDKLQQVLGIQKLDKQYLKLDRLSTFINSDLKEDESLLKVFQEAGCADLFELPDRIIRTKKEKEEIAGTLNNYLNLNADSAEAGQETDSITEDTLLTGQKVEA
jgi:hypothetical protein